MTLGSVLKAVEAGECIVLLGAKQGRKRLELDIFKLGVLYIKVFFQVP